MYLQEINNKLEIMAETVKAQVLYELNMSYDPAEFFKLRFQRRFFDYKKLCNVIFKTNPNGRMS